MLPPPALIGPCLHLLLTLLLCLCQLCQQLLARLLLLGGVQLLAALVLAYISGNVWLTWVRVRSCNSGPAFSLQTPHCKIHLRNEHHLAGGGGVITRHTIQHGAHLSVCV